MATTVRGIAGTASIAAMTWVLAVAAMTLAIASMTWVLATAAMTSVLAIAAIDISTGCSSYSIATSTYVVAANRLLLRSHIAPESCDRNVVGVPPVTTNNPCGRIIEHVVVMPEHNTAIVCCVFLHSPA